MKSISQAARERARARRRASREYDPTSPAASRAHYAALERLDTADAMLRRTLLRHLKKLRPWAVHPAEIIPPGAHPVARRYYAR